MLFKLAPNTPCFQIFSLLNAELLHFIEQAVTATEFSRELFSAGAVGHTCWDNAKENNRRADKDLTRDKFEKLFSALQAANEATRRRLFETIRDHQNLQAFFNTPSRELLGFLPTRCLIALKAVATHLYCATKDLVPIISAAGGTNITLHFNAFRTENGNVCKACGMKELATFRAGVPDGDQWRADYDHQLCKSKYPIFSVHPDNLIPLCDACNQDAKKAKDLFRDNSGNDRLAFYPYHEEAKGLVSIHIDNLHDPEPTTEVKWATTDAVLINKLDTWDDIYEIRSRIEGKFRSLEATIEDEINPTDPAHFEARVHDEARAVPENTLKRKECAFWNQKLFFALSQIDLAPFIAKWDFVRQQGAEGAEHILNCTI